LIKLPFHGSESNSYKVNKEAYNRDVGAEEVSEYLNRRSITGGFREPKLQEHYLCSTKDGKRREDS